MLVFVVLHYMALPMTEECIETLEGTFAQQSFHIVVVDNGSPDSNGFKLQKKYRGDNRVTVILNEKNLGFAQGNNVGYQYVRNIGNADFVVVMNNDVLIHDKGFIERVYSIYRETSFAVLGPDIYASRAGTHQSPMRLKGYTRAEVQRIHNQRVHWLAIYPLYYGGIYSVEKVKAIVKKAIHWKPRNASLINPYAAEKRIENPVLHGACIIFSKNYMKNEENAFNPNTFLYLEEDILHTICMKKGYKMIYDSSIRVEHLEDISTNALYKSDYKKLKMKFKNLVKSSEVLLSIMEDRE